MNRPAAGTADASLPGPSDRVHFEQMQARQRRAARWYGALGLVAVITAGAPVSLVVTPLLFLVTRIGIHLVGLITPLPPIVPALGQQIDDVVRASLATVAAFQWPAIDLRVALLLFLPGAVAMLALWLGVLGLLKRAGAGGELLALGIRERVSPDFEESQLENVVGEMAVAAGTQPLAVRLLDVPAANAAAVGTSSRDATLVVTRGLLNRLNRDETQAVIGHLVASIGNGDLRMATTLLSVQQTLGCLTAILSAPFGGRSRRLLRQLLSPVNRQETALVAELLAVAGLDTEDDITHQFRQMGSGGWPERVLVRWPLFPLVFLAITARAAATLVIGGLFGPVFAAVWRRRRRVADAMAVQLTRNPNALASALASLSGVEHHLPGALSTAHLFVVWQPDQTGRHLSSVFGGLGTLAPSLGRRREALRRMGATSVAVPRRAWGWRDLLSGPSRTILLVLPPLVLLGVYLAVLTLGAMITVNFLVLGLLLVGLNRLIDLVFSVLVRLFA